MEERELQEAGKAGSMLANSSTTVMLSDQKNDEKTAGCERR